MNKRLVDKIDDSSLVDYEGGKKLAVVFCVDISQSMNRIVDGTNAVSTGKTIRGEDGREYNLVSGGINRLAKVREGVESIVSYFRNSKEVSPEQVEIATVFFNETISLENPFVPLNQVDIHSIPQFGSGQTHMGEAVAVSLDLLEKRISQYGENETNFYRPWLLVFTDGEDRGPQAIMEESIKRANQLENTNKLMTYCFGINDQELNLEVLKRLNNNFTIYPIKAVDLADIFEMITYTMGQTATGQLDNPKIKIDADMKRYLEGH